MPLKRPGLKLNIEVDTPDPLAQSFAVQDGGSAYESQGMVISKDGNISSKHADGAEGKSLDEADSSEAGLQRSDLDVLRILGRGASSRVELVKHKETGEYMALKVIDISDRNRRHNIIAEIKTLFNASCKTLVGFHGAFFDGGTSISIALEMMDQGCLHTVLGRYGAIPEPVLAAATFQTLWGLGYLQHEKRVHRDIKPQNILCNSKGEVKLTDFGISKQLEDSIGMCNTFVGTFKYLSPERIRSQPYSYPSDIWSFGLVLIECATGNYPYPECKTYIDMVQTVLEEGVPTLPKDEFTPEFDDFIRCCLQKKPDDRVPAEVLLGSPWLVLHEATSLKHSQKIVRRWFRAERKKRGEHHKDATPAEEGKVANESKAEGKS